MHTRVVEKDADVHELFAGPHPGHPWSGNLLTVGDLAVLWAVIERDVVLVRGRGEEGTSAMQREADGCWYSID